MPRNAWHDNVDDFFAFGESSKGGLLPFSTICHSEPPLRGVSSLNRGGEQTLLKLYPKSILSIPGGKTEIVRYAQDDQNTVGSKGGLLPFRLERRCHTSFDMTINGEGISRLLKLHPKVFFAVLGLVGGTLPLLTICHPEMPF